MSRRRRDHDRPNVVRKALDSREQLDEHLSDPAYLSTVVLDFIDQMSGMFANGDGHIVMLNDEQRAHRVRVMASKWRGSLRVGEVYAVTQDMHYLVEQAAADLPDDYIAEHHHLHAEHGFLWLPERIVEPTQGGVDMPPTDLLTWHNGTGWSQRVNGGKGGSAAGIEVNLWARTREGVLVPVGSDFLPYGWPALGWRSYGFPDGMREVLEPEQRLSNSTRFVLALQMLMRQELPSLDRYPVPRADLRHLRRIEMPESDVTVISLRRRSYKDRTDVEHPGGHLTRRHIVRGHWHAYWVGPTHEQHPGETEEKVRIYKYVNPYVKGPEDGEWALTPQRVHVVRR